MTFFYIPKTFTTDPRVVGLVAGSVPVVHPHNTDDRLLMQINEILEEGKLWLYT